MPCSSIENWKELFLSLNTISQLLYWLKLYLGMNAFTVVLHFESYCVHMSIVI